MIPGILNHLWQSTLFAVGAGLLTLALRRQTARTRYWIWLAALVKFLIPFAALVYAGSFLDWRSVPNTPPAASTVLDERFLGPVLAVASPAPARTTSGYLPSVLGVVWLCGFVVVVARWLREWRKLRSFTRSAKPLDRELPIPALVVPSALEPGVFGIARPVLLLPHGITDRLSEEELGAIVAHEVCHVRHRDNLTAAIQMFVEAVFWFHPLVSWIGSQLLAERERACDEEVLRAGGEPRIYAEGILKVCEFYLESPLACLSGVTGSDLRRRIRGIMTHQVTQRLDSTRKLLLSAAAGVSIALPLLIGVVNAPQIRAQSQSSGGKGLSFDVASIRPSSRDKVVRIGATVNPQGVEFMRFSLRNLIAEAYNVKSRSITAPDQGTRILLDGLPFDIQAKCDHAVTRDQIQLMLQSLLAERFKLAFHRESKVEPVYNLVTAKSGPKLEEIAGGPEGCALGPFGGAICHHMTMLGFSNYLSDRMGRVVVDRTGLSGFYNFDLHLDGTPGLDQIREAMASSADPGDTKRSLATSLRDWTNTSIFSDIQKQLGLKLEADRATVENIVIDHAQRPSEN